MSNGTFDIPELRCANHFYGAPLLPYQAQAPKNEGVVIVPPCPECGTIQNAKEEAFESMFAALKKIAYEPFGQAEASCSEVLQAITDCARAALVPADKVRS